MKRNVFSLDCMDCMRMLKTSMLPLMLCLLVSSWAVVVAGADEKSAAVSLFEQANILHTQGEFQQAAEQYSSIISTYGVSAPLLYNLANSYAAVGQVGLAVLNYERALRLAPGDADIQGNVAQVRKDAGLYRDNQPLHRRLAEMLGADQWLMIAGCAFLCLGLSALLATTGLVGQGGKSLYWLMIGSLAVVLLALPPAVFRYQDWKIGVVLAEDAHLVISPFADAASAGDIKVGRLIRPEREHGDYVLVTAETGKAGWLNKGSFALVTE
ncbi:TPR repeat-containing protein [Candidatus Electrothrix communis]|uniref:TPR repeat-containing protein n=1 Tax=Candidatus Electrothrix communis TaxID=1859133 RepID=A0A3S3UCQ0_9BACT|nr:TPR repeat-containing protein [Candidatus Electrothrix communis]